MAEPETQIASEEASEDRFRALFQSELSWMWSTLRRLGVRPADLEDVTHEVFLAVYKRIEAYDPTRAVRPWLFAFAYREASDYRRLARHREDSSESLPDPPAEGTPADEAIERREESALVHAALARVDFDRRAVIIAHELDGTPMKDVASALGIPLNTAYSRLRIGREELTHAITRLVARGGVSVTNSRGER